MTTTPDVTPDSVNTVLADIDELQIKAWMQEVAQVLDRKHDASVEFWVSLSVVVLSTIVGGTVFASLTTSPQPAAKVLVGVLSVAAAVAAALNQWGPLAGGSEKHATSASKFSNIHDQLHRLAREMKIGDVTVAEANKQLGNLETDYGNEEGAAPVTTHFDEAEKWVNQELQKSAETRLRLPPAVA